MSGQQMAWPIDLMRSGLVLVLGIFASLAARAGELRLGIIGCDTSHSVRLPVPFFAVSFS
jgi:hypothetical protein